MTRSNILDRINKLSMSSPYIKNILQILAKNGKDNNEKLVKKGERVKEHSKELDITK